MVSSNVCSKPEAPRNMLPHLASYLLCQHRITLWSKRTPLICRLGDIIIFVTNVYCRNVEESLEIQNLQVDDYISDDYHSTKIFFLQGSVRVEIVLYFCKAT